jgi:histidinol phosphatase-like enzyme
MRWGASRVQTQYFGVYQALRLDAFLFLPHHPTVAADCRASLPGCPVRGLPVTTSQANR